MNAELVEKALEEIGYDWGIWDNVDLVWRQKCIAELAQAAIVTARIPPVANVPPPVPVVMGEVQTSSTGPD